MAKLNPDSFRNQTDALFPTNGVGEIDAGDLRTQLDNVADSVSFIATVARAPLATDDSYNIGDFWLDTNGNELYYCTGNASGAATWIEVGGETETPSGASGNFVEWGASTIIDSGKSVPTGDVVGTSDSQTLTNKTIDADNNSISNLAHGSEVDNPTSGVHGVTGNIVGTTDTQTLTNKTIDANNNTILNLTSGVNVQEEGSGVVTEASTLNFVGAEITVTDVGGVATITHVPGSVTVSGDDITSGTVGIAYLPEATEAEYLDNTPDRLISTDQLWTSVEEKTLSDVSGLIPFDLSSGINFTITLDGDRILETPSNAKPGQSGHIRVVQDGTGSRTITYGYGYEFAAGNPPVLSTTANAEDLLFYKALTSDRIFINAITGIEPGAEEPPQPTFSNVVLLVPMDGDIVDYSNNSISMSSQLFSYTNDDPFLLSDAQSGNFTAGSDSRVYTPGGALPAQYLGNGDLCIEAWVWRDSSAPTSGVAQIVGDYDSNFFNNNTWRLLIDQGNGRRIRLQTNGGPNITFDSAVTDETWHHVALVRESGTIRLYFDGEVDAQTTSSGFNFGGDSEQIWIGRGISPAPYDGYISDVRLTSGEPVYTAAFDPPRTPHPRS